jgi:hypothetical protein
LVAYEIIYTVNRIKTLSTPTLNIVIFEGTLVYLNSKFPPPVELCWQNKNIFKLGILITKVGKFYKHDSKTLKLVHKFILLLEFDFLPPCCILEKVFVLFLYSKIWSCKNGN